MGEAILLGGEFLPTLSGTMGLMGSSCVSNSSRSSATGAVSAGAGTRLIVAAPEFSTAFADPAAALESGFRWKLSGCFEGWSLSGCTISARPLAPFHGSRGFAITVSTGAGFVPKRLARSAKGAFFFAGSCGPLTET